MFVKGFMLVLIYSVYVSHVPLYVLLAFRFCRAVFRIRAISLPIVFQLSANFWPLSTSTICSESFWATFTLPGVKFLVFAALLSVSIRVFNFGNVNVIVIMLGRTRRSVTLRAVKPMTHLKVFLSKATFERKLTDVAYTLAQLSQIERVLFLKFFFLANGELWLASQNHKVLPTKCHF